MKGIAPFTLGVLITLFAVFAFACGRIPPPSFSNDYHDGLSIHTDTTTGCQYVSAKEGKDLTPRMDSNGKQICRVQL